MGKGITRIIPARRLAMVSGLMILLAAPLALVDYSAATMPLAGLVLSWAIYLFLRWPGKGLIAVFCLIILVAILTLLGPSMSSDNFGCLTIFTDPQISIIVDGSKLATGTVDVSGRIATGPGQTSPFSFSCPSKAVAGRAVNVPPMAEKLVPRGLLLSEVLFGADDMWRSQSKDLSFLDFRSEKVSVELRNFPPGSFYRAQWAQAMNISTTQGVETIRWSQSYDVVNFMVIPPDRTLMRPLVELLYPLTRTIQVLVAIGSIMVLPVTIVIEPVVRLIERRRKKTLDVDHPPEPPNET